MGETRKLKGSNSDHLSSSKELLQQYDRLPFSNVLILCAVFNLGSGPTGGCCSSSFQF